MVLGDISYACMQASPDLAYGAKGGVCSKHTVSGTSWTALTLEVGKSPTEVPPRRRLPVALPSAISEFASSSSPSWSPNRAVLDDGRQHGELDQGVRARPALGACATRPGHAVNVLAEEPAPLQATPWRSIHAAPRLCAPLPAALPEAQSSQILRAACAQPAAQSPGDA